MTVRLWICLFCTFFLSKNVSAQVRITLPMGNKTVLEGSSVRMSTNLNQPSINGGNWTYNGGGLSSNFRYTTGIEGEMQYLDITNIQLSDGGSYSYAFETATSSGNLVVLALMNNITARVGQTITLGTGVTPNTDGMWFKDGAPLDTVNGKYAIVANGNLRQLTVKDLTANDGGKYAFRVNDVDTAAYLQLEVNGGFGPWANWETTDCQSTCGEGVRARNRLRLCDSPAPTGDGLPCQETSTERTTEICYNRPCQIDGNWNQWSQWLGPACSDCGGGTVNRTRTRQCNSPRPFFGGRECDGENLEEQIYTCETNACPVDGSWVKWNEWVNNSCSASCGRGTLFRTRTRVCTGVLNGGQYCPGSDTETESIECEITKCPVDGSWSNWVSVEPPCPVTCGGGEITISKTRECNNPATANGGQQCPENAVETESKSCNIQLCPVNGTWTQWTQWLTGDCSVTCGGSIATRNRTRQCIPPQNGGAYCTGPDTDNDLVECSINLCIVDGNWSPWNEWTVPPCPVTCGKASVTKRKERLCNNPAPINGGRSCQGNDSETLEEQCIDDTCPQDGAWAPWNQWTDGTCSVSCGTGSQRRTRSRSCVFPDPTNPGRSCPGLDSDSDTQSCEADSCPVDGFWSNWNEWSVDPCPVSCGGAETRQNRNRTCDNPSPQNGGRSCEGSAFDSATTQCNSDPCVVYGQWSQWVPWTFTPCSASCGGGTRSKSRIRQCDSPAPSGGGNFCDGQGFQVETEDCGTDLCPVDGKPSPWGEWRDGECSRSCGTGTLTRSRTRTCNNPSPLYGGIFCVEPLREDGTRTCNTDPCQIDGQWTPWNQWTNGVCSATCGDGTLVRRRRKLCNNPAPANRGAFCQGSDTETQQQPCNLGPCRVDGVWSNWNEWSNPTCPVTCEGPQVTRERRRMCNNPPAQNGGAGCPGTALETLTFRCNPYNCPVDGAWSPWNQWSTGTCSHPCGGGKAMRTRTKQCNNPAPRDGGTYCPGPDTEITGVDCNTDPCSIGGNWGSWAPWTEPNCPVTCGGGNILRERRRECDSPAPTNGTFCADPTSNVQKENLTCNGNPCKVDGNFGPWTNWVTGDCQSTCGEGVRARTRSRLCDSPETVGNGRPCNGSSSERETAICYNKPCPIDGNWSQWTQWLGPDCPACGGGTVNKTRLRVCNSPRPFFGGRDCAGYKVQKKVHTCEIKACPVNGGWSEWAPWTVLPCSASCNGGTSTKYRSKRCDSPAPSGGGNYCSGQGFGLETETCGTDACPVDGNWGCWAPWTEPSCPVTCGGGNIVRKRRRECDSPAPSFGGKNCADSRSNVQMETRTCNDDLCGGCHNFTAVIVLDGSESIRAPNFLTIKAVLQNFTRQAISQNSFIKIGIVVYSDEVTQVIAATSDPEFLSTAVGDITYPNSGTATHLGLEAARKLLLEQDSKRVKFMIVLTDGLSSQPSKTHTAANKAKDDGITIVVLGVTEFFTRFSNIQQQFDAELNNMATSGFLSTSETFDSLSNVTSSLLQELCGSPVWSVWGPWVDSPCPVTCGTEAVRPSTRTRTCLSGSQTASECRGPSSEEAFLSCGITIGCPGGPEKHTNVIVGATCGAGLLLLLIVCFVCVCLYKSRNRKKQRDTPESEDNDPAKRSGVYADRVYQSQATLNTSSGQNPW